MLSNLTASAILFFNHVIRIGDSVTIIDVDYYYTRVITDITGFFLFIKTDKDKKITLPTYIIMQKGIEILGKLEEGITVEENYDQIIKGTRS
ncbi:mechanosensitive ion channel domain-containing protein [Patiriisocius sp. Uisw_017]|uniref:mechanosensitive ion channel domain-containing protein n=1 Tax=Patiriisocius sp. Uisw_017 TaxID=3230968 RepID=UPI0039EBECFB